MGDKDQDQEKYFARTGEYALSKRKIEAAQARFNDGEDGSLLETAPIPTNPDYYKPPSRFQAEMKKARPVFEEYRDAARQMINDVRVGRPLGVRDVLLPMKGMIESVIRHPDPMVWMTQLLIPESFLSGHLIRTSVLSVVIGRGMGLPERQLERLALGSLLCQIGKAKLPRRLLEKPGPLARDELEKIRGFVGMGVELVEAVRGMEREVVDIVRFHHERFDGSGYPGGVKADEIPLLARVVGVADWYDTMTSQKPYTDQVISSTEAVDLLNHRRNLLFQSQIVDEFIRTIGLYPNGNLVELDTGEIGLVQCQNPENRTQPRILLVLDTDQMLITPPRQVDLLSYNQGSKGHPMTIRRALPDGEYGLDPASIMQTAGAVKKGWRRLIPGG